MDKIDIFRGKYSFLSNFESHRGLIAIPFDSEKILFFPHVEGAYQAMKCLDPLDRLKFVGLSPSDSKKLGKQILRRDDWQEIKFGVMKNCLAQKFANNSNFRVKLVATGDSGIVEGNFHHDNEWGDCYCDECDGIKGENHLGRLLMELREKLK